jgi:hypothetical protein
MSLSKKNLITNYFKKITKNNDLDSIKIDNYTKNGRNVYYGYNKETGNWHCIDCGENMGDNPRQLCGKGMCVNSYENIV